MSAAASRARGRVPEAAHSAAAVPAACPIAIEGGTTRTAPAASLVAELCGFCHASYLVNLFRRETGLTPREWGRERI